MPDGISKSELVQRIAEKCSKLTRDEVKFGRACRLPGFAKFVVVEKPATSAHDGINPFTKAPMRFEAKPASKAVKARLLKGIKDAVS